MVIPHSEKHVIKIQLSNYLLLFSLSIFTVLLGLFSYQIFESGGIEKDTERLLSETSKQELLLYSLRRQVEYLKDRAGNLVDLTNKYHRYLWPKSYLDDRADYRDIKDRFDSEPPAVESVQNLYEDFKTYRTDLRNLKDYYSNAGKLLARRWYIFDNMPSGNPLPPGIGMFTSPFGKRASPLGFKNESSFHTGQDIAGIEGTPIYATGDGVVESVNTAPPYGGLGKFVRIRHEFGFKSVYAHCSRVVVGRDEVVKRGQLIGYVGQTGVATGPHLHYEIMIGFEFQNPKIYLVPLDE